MYQGDLLKNGFEKERWRVVDVHWHYIENKKTGTKEKFYTYCKTVPVDWEGPEKIEGAPWE
jgi:hypothetical protein